MKRSKNRRGLSTEDATLWRGVTKTVRPIHNAAASNALPGASPSAAGASTMEKLLKSAGSKKGPTSGTTKKYAQQKRAPARSFAAHGNTTVAKQSPVGAGDPRLDRRAARRRVPIERTLDLHGLTQAAAQSRLSTFIKDAYASGLRCVLVVTGKGGLVHASHIYDAPTDDDPFWGGKSKGVLRRNFPDWVSAPGLRPLIARVAPAHQKDGGAGAWYVFLKRNDH